MSLLCFDSKKMMLSSVARKYLWITPTSSSSAPGTYQNAYCSVYCPLGIDYTWSTGCFLNPNYVYEVGTNRCYINYPADADQTIAFKSAIPKTSWVCYMQGYHSTGAQFYLVFYNGDTIVHSQTLGRAEVYKSPEFIVPSRVTKVILHASGGIAIAGRFALFCKHKDGTLIYDEIGR